jgi:hypothetical protein
MPSVTKQRQLDLVSARIELTGGKYSTRKLGSDIRNLQKLVGTKSQRRAIGQAVTDKAVAKVQGAGKYNTKKFASDVRNVQSVIGTKAQRRAVGDAITGKALAKIAGSGVMLAGRGHKKTRLEKAMGS